MTRRSRRRTAVLTGVAVLLLATAATGAAAAPQPGTANAANSTRGTAQAGAQRAATQRGAALRAASTGDGGAAAAARQFGIPPWKSIHPNGKVGQGYDTQTTATKPKVIIHFKPISALVHLILCFDFSGSKRCVDPTGDPSVLNGYPDTGDLGLAVGYGPAWFQSGPKENRPFGVLPGVRVAALAFGSIPVTATVHISQPVGPRYVTPLRLKFAAGLSNAPKGTVLKGFPYGPAPFASNAAYFPSNVDGPVDVRLSDVRVDRIAVPVGPECHAPSSSLHLNSPAGWANAALPPQKGKPGEYAGLSAVDFGYLQGTADVGSFTGCHNGGDDLDPLLTSFISAENNPVDVKVTSGLINWCTKHIGSIDCAPYDDVSTATASANTAGAASAGNPQVVARSATRAVPDTVLQVVPKPVARALTGQASSP